MSLLGAQCHSDGTCLTCDLISIRILHFGSLWFKKITRASSWGFIIFYDLIKAALNCVWLLIHWKGFHYKPGQMWRGCKQSKSHGSFWHNYWMHMVQQLSQVWLRSANISDLFHCFDSWSSCSDHRLIWALTGKKSAAYQQQSTSYPSD